MGVLSPADIDQGCQDSPLNASDDDCDKHSDNNLDQSQSLEQELSEVEDLQAAITTPIQNTATTRKIIDYGMT